MRSKAIKRILVELLCVSVLFTNENMTYTAYASEIPGAGEETEPELEPENPPQTRLPVEGTAAEGYGDVTWKIDMEGKLTVSGTGDICASENREEEGVPWSEYFEEITSVQIDDWEGLTDASFLFSGCSNLVSADLSGLDTADVTSFESMFEGCMSLEGVWKSDFDTSQVENMCFMFGECGKLEALDVSDFDTSNVTDMWGMFKGCRSLTTLDVSGFDTSNVIDLGSMFEDCNNLQEVDVSNFNTSSVTDMYRMFANCHKLENLDVSNFDTSNVESMDGMFESCRALTVLDVSGFDTRKVEDMSSMFWGCWELTALDVSGFDTRSVIDMYGMFAGCKSLLELNVKSFHTSNTVKMDSMFNNCSFLEELDLSSFSTSQVTTMRNMFNGCTSLKRLNLSSFDMSNVTDIGNFLYRNYNLELIQAPVHLKGTISLPVSSTSKWYMEDGTEITEFPQNLEHSVNLGKNEIPPAFSPVMYTVVFDLQNHGESSAEYSEYTDLKAGDKIEAPTPPVCAGYVFTGWYRDAACTEPWDFAVDTIHENMTLYAGWQEDEGSGKDPGENPGEDPGKNPGDTIDKTYTVTFDLQGYGTASESYAAAELKAGSKIEEPPVPVQAGYKFTGWYTDAACTTRWDFTIHTVESDITLYAGWTKDESLGDIRPEDLSSGIQISDTDTDERWYTSVQSVTYTGKALTPEIRVYNGTELLYADRDFTLKYRNNLKASDKAEIVLKWKAPYSGTQSIPFHIEPANLKETEAEPIVVAWNGKEQKKVPALTWYGKKLVHKKDFTTEFPDSGNGAYKDPGTYRVILHAGKSGNFTGDKEATLVITDNTLMSKTSVKKIPKQPYGKDPATPSVTVTSRKDGTLQEGVHYTVSYENNDKPGTASVILTGIKENGYEGTKKVNFQIKGISLKKARVEGLEKKTYTGEEQFQNFQVVLSNTILTEGVDYETVYTKNRNAGKAIVTITGIGEYTGTIKKSFKIEPYMLKYDENEDIEGLDNISLIKTDKGYKAEAQLTFCGRKMMEGRDYLFYYSKGIKGIVVRVKGRGNFKGSSLRTVTPRE